MIPELQWEIAMYLTFPEIEISFPNLVSNDIFLAALMARDYQGVEGGREMYIRLEKMREYGRKYDEGLQFEMLEMLSSGEGELLWWWHQCPRDLMTTDDFRIYTFYLTPENLHKLFLEKGMKDQLFISNKEKYLYINMISSLSN